MKRILTAVAVVLVSASAASAQTPAPAFDGPAFLASLKNSKMRTAALLQFPTLPEAALVPLAEAAADPATDPAVQKALADHLPKLYARLRTHTAAQDKALDAAWTKTHLMDVYKRSPGGGKAVPEVTAAFDDITAGEKDYTVFKAAVDAQAAAGVKPDDPAIHVAYVVSGLVTHAMALDHASKQLDPALARLDASAYSDGVKFVLHRWLLACMTTPDWPADFPVKASFKGESDRVLQLLPAFVAEHPGRARLQRILFNAYYALWRRLSTKEAYDRISPVIDKALIGDAITDDLAAQFYETWAWDARGYDVISAVSAANLKLFEQRLEQCTATATRGWREDPLDGSSCKNLIAVAMGTGQDDATMQKWFQRAIWADPDDLSAYSDKANFLAPEWHGDPQQTLAFGQECLKKGTARNRISLVMVDIIDDMAAHADEPADIYHQPQFWADIQAAYAVVLGDPTRMKDDRGQLLFDRAKLMQYALLCDQPQAFLDLLKKYGNDIDVTALGGKDRLAFYERQATKELKSGAAGSGNQASK